MAGASLHDIREWGKANGFNVAEGSALPRGLREAYRKRNDDDVITAIVPDEEEGSRAVETERPTMPEVLERPPNVKEGIVVRARKALGKGPDDAPKVRASTHARKPVDRIIGRVWEGFARLMAPVNLPVARVLTTQAPVAGMLLEDIVKHTVVDKMLQPIVRAEEKGELAFALIGPPLLVGLLSTPRGQAFAPALVPALKESLRLWIEVAGPKVIEAKKRDEEFQEKYGNTIDAMIDGFFAPMPDQPQMPDQGDGYESAA